MIDMEKKFGDIVELGGEKGVIVGFIKKTKHIFYYVVFEHSKLTGNDFTDCLIEYDEVREDKLV